MARWGQVRRPAWALPPQPPETWVGGLWLAAFVLCLAVAALVPLAPLWGDTPPDRWVLVAARGLAAGSAVIAGFVLVVQSTVYGDRRLSWVAGGYGLAFLLSVSGAGRADVDRLEALAMLTVLAVPVFAVTAALVRRGLPLLVLSALGLAGGAAVIVATRPDLLDGNQLPPSTRALWGALALACGAVAISWLQADAPPRRWVGAGLAIAAVAAGLHAAATARRDQLWWAGLAAEDLSLLVPAVGLSARTVLGYGRQSRRWHQLEAEVKALRRGSRLLEGRSITPEDDEGLPGRAEVRAILDAAAVRVALQPVMELASGSTVGHEALSRFGGRVPTDRWFKAASKHGYGDELERLCLGAALALLPTLPPAQFLAVNVSPATLSDPTVLGLLESVDLRRVVVEVTEHEAVADYAGARTILDRLRAAGARIAVDDTGAGFASLRHVLMLQPDIIKLDIGLTRDVDVDRRQQALVRAVTAFAHQVGTTVLAEGIETQEQLDTLREIGVQLGQGWHLGVPALATQ